jgi:hypothetical protein
MYVSYFYSNSPDTKYAITVTPDKFGLQSKNLGPIVRGFKSSVAKIAQLIRGFQSLFSTGW